VHKREKNHFVSNLVSNKLVDYGLETARFDSDDKKISKKICLSLFLKLL